MREELIPFAESLGVTGGDRLELTIGQERLLHALYGDRPPDVDRWDLELEVAAQERRRGQVHAIAVAMLQGREVSIAPGLANGELRRFLQDVRHELELIGRTLNLDVRSSLERLATVALRATTR